MIFFINCPFFHNLIYHQIMVFLKVFFLYFLYFAFGSWTVFNFIYKNFFELIFFLILYVNCRNFFCKITFGNSSLICNYKDIIFLEEFSCAYRIINKFKITILISISLVKLIVLSLSKNIAGFA